MTNVTIGIDEDIWAKLMMIKASRKIRSFNSVLEYLIQNQKPELSNSLPKIKSKLESSYSSKKVRK